MFMKSYKLLVVLFFSILLIVSILFILKLPTRSRVVTLGKGDCTTAHIKCAGITRVSGPHAVIYGAADKLGLKTVGDKYTFKSEIVVNYSFGWSDLPDLGWGKIYNVTDKTAVMRVTCIDGYGLKEETLIIEVVPKTFNRIDFENKDRMTPGNVNKIECELIKLY